MQLARLNYRISFNVKYMEIKKEQTRYKRCINYIKKNKKG